MYNAYRKLHRIMLRLLSAIIPLNIFHSRSVCKRCVHRPIIYFLCTLSSHFPFAIMSSGYACELIHHVKLDTSVHFRPFALKMYLYLLTPVLSSNPPASFRQSVLYYTPSSVHIYEIWILFADHL